MQEAKAGAPMPCGQLYATSEQRSSLGLVWEYKYGGRASSPCLDGVGCTHQALLYSLGWTPLARVFSDGSKSLHSCLCQEAAWPSSFLGEQQKQAALFLLPLMG